MTIEIGTSDFRTQAGQVEGIFIEPVKYYFDRLPECNKINCAISDYEGEIDIYYLTDEEISRYQLPNWVRGCNSVNAFHPSVVSLLFQNGLDPNLVIQKDKVPVLRIKSIIDEHNLTAIDFMKIDTEGHDCIILNDFLDTVAILPKRIQFEANDLSRTLDVWTLMDRLSTNFGYTVVRSKDDIIATL